MSGPGIHNLFVIVSAKSTDGGWIGEVHLNSDHEIFDGHFPGFPVLPGVSWLLAAKLLMESIHGKLNVLTITEIKFLSLVDPRKCREFQLKAVHTLDNPLRISCEVINLLDNKTVARLRAEFCMEL